MKLIKYCDDYVFTIGFVLGAASIIVPNANYFALVPKIPSHSKIKYEIYQKFFSKTLFMKSMKKLITSVILFVSFSQCIYSQEYAVYFSNKQKTILTTPPKKVLSSTMLDLPNFDKKAK
ncbi:hypothetical protein SAMN04488541_1010110 [Thermoflexibacter ruber]|uniref:Uncharacterized protein n=2 Tax=Thermoflexibacter ruber TaxID=1003 RepID=A0A1I2END6_9BACT|nr:hypothetical protein SAMN04488541_1010110 [Thermoflexibacter ruber]